MRKTALFRLSVHGAILQHIRTVTIQQRGGPSGATLDPDVELEDVPSWIRDEIREDGHALVAGGLS